MLIDLKVPYPRVVAVAIAVALACTMTLHAQEQSAEPTPQPAARFAMEIVVTPERGETPRTLVPAAIVAIDAPALTRIPAQDLSEVISTLPGVAVARAQFAAGRPIVSARGFFGGGEAEYVGLLVDGVRVGHVESGLVEWSLVPASSMRRLEALRGPGASEYGDSAIGGMIQVFTARPGGEARVSAGSFGTVAGDGSWGHRASGATFVLSGAARRTDGAFAHSAANQLVGAGSAEGAVRDFTWRFSASGHDQEREEPGALSREAFARAPQGSDPLFRFDSLDQRALSTAFTLRHSTLPGRPVARVHVNYRVEDTIRTILLVPELGDRQARAVSALTLGGSVDGEHVFDGARPTTVRFGAEITRERLETSYSRVAENGASQLPDAAVDGYRIRLGGFVSGAWQPARRVRLSAAVRRDTVEDEGFTSNDSSASNGAWSPRAGITVQLNESGTVTLFGQASKAFKAPTLDQLFDPRPFPDFRGGTFVLSNRTLVPMRAANLEVGVSGGGAVRWTALAYRMAVEDEIDFDVRTFSYANIGPSRHVGAEIDVAAAGWRRVRPSVSYALSRVTRADGELQLKNVPQHRVSLAVDLDLLWALGAHARLSHWAGAFLDDENVFSTEWPGDARRARPAIHRPRPGVRGCVQPAERSLRGVRLHARGLQGPSRAIRLSGSTAKPESGTHVLLLTPSP